MGGLPVLDTEDAVKKGLVSFADVIEYLRHEGGKDKTINKVIEYASGKHEKYRKLTLSPSELNEISMQMFRVGAIGAMIRDISETFETKIPSIMSETYHGDLVADSASSRLYKALKTFGFNHAYKHRSVLKIELQGHNILMELMDMLWQAITDRESYKVVSSPRKVPFSRYAYSRISENYRRVFESPSSMPIRYREAQLLTDMISGMTDSYALAIHKELKEYCVD